jgi:hypothetical protein
VAGKSPPIRELEMTIKSHRTYMNLTDAFFKRLRKIRVLLKPAAISGAAAMRHDDPPSVTGSGILETAIRL